MLAIALLGAWLAVAGAASAQTVPDCFGAPPTVVGTGGSDTLTGTPGDDVIVSLEGSDLIDGLGGNDRICGGGGNDTIEGSAGNDLINGDAGADTISGGDGNDRIFGGLGRDRLEGDAGNDALFGDEGADEMDGDSGFDNCFVESRLDDARGCETNNPPNQPPTDILLSNSAVAENQPANTTVGALSAVDPDVGDSHTFTLATGPGDTGNASFQITGSNLQTSTQLDFETQSIFSVRVRATDAGGLFVDKSFTITVTDANDPPVGVNDSATVSEDSGANAIDVLGNDNDPDGGAKSVQSVTQPPNGSVAITGGGTGLSYTPNADYCNSGGAEDTFTYTLNGGSTATVSVGVTCVDDAPVAGNDSATVAEDSAASTIDVLANDTDIDGGPKGVDSVTQPANGSVAITGGGTGVDYTPDADYCNDPPGNSADIFTYTLNGGSSATVSVTVACSDDNPVAVDDSTTVSEDSGANAVDVLGNDTDVDGGPKGVDSVTQPANGSAAITGGGTGVDYTPDAGYCNDPPGNSADTFTYTLNGGSSATVSVTVTCADDSPTAVNDSATVTEDSGANAIDVLANDTDPDGGTKSVDSVTQPANGSVAITGGGTGLTYTPNADYCNDPPGNSADTFTYTLNGGSSATVSVTVNCADDNPTAVDDSATVTEDSSANAIDVLANDTDPDGGTTTVDSVSQPANGSVTITGAGTGLTYTQNPNYCNAPPGTSPDTFTYTLNGGSSATVSVTVTCLDDLPTAVNDSATVTEDSGANSIDVLANDTDPDGGTKSVDSVTQPANGSVTITGGGTGLTYTPNPDYCNSSTTDDTFTYTVNGGSSATVSVQVTCADDPPVAVNDSATVTEDSSSNAIDVLANDTDTDGGPKTVESVTQPANGAAAIAGDGTGVSYSPAANYCNDPPGTTPDTFAYTLNGGFTATVSVTVTCVADNPVVDTSAGSLDYAENDPATPIDGSVSVTHPDAGATITGATVAITANFAAGQDVLALSGTHPGISANFAGDTLTLSGTASPAAYQAALQAVTYANTSEGPSTLTRTATFTVTDGAALSGSDTRSITVAGVNDPPAAVNDSGTTDEDTVLNVPAPGVLANDTDVDPGDTKTVVALNGSATLTGTSAKGGSVTINANGSYSYTPPAAFQALSTGQSDTDSFAYTMADSAGAQSGATANLTVEGVSDAPTAVADTFDAVGNTGLFTGTSKPAGDAGKVITGSILANDTDPDTPQANLVAEPVTNAPTALGGAITIEADGNFTYHPDDGDTGATDAFTYRVCDNSPCNSGTVANSTGTVNLVLTGQVWYVRNNQAAGGDGTSDTPFDTLAEAETASGGGDTVYVFDGDNTQTNLDTGYVTDSNERLLGEVNQLGLDPDGGGPLATVSLFAGTPAALPTLAANNEDVVSMAASSVVDGFNINPGGAGGGIAAGPGAGGGGASNVTISNVNVVDTAPLGTQPGVDLDGTTGTNVVSGLSVTNGGSATAIGVRVNNAGTVNFAPAGTVTIATNGAKALDAAGTNMSTSAFDDITVTGSGTGGVRLNNNTGSTTLGDGAGTDLSLQTTSGAAAALDVSSAGTVQVDAAGTDTISATGGPAVDIRNTNSSGFDFDSVNSTNSANDGINLDNNLVTPFVASGGAISGAAGIAVDVNGGGANVSYPGAVNDGAGSAAEVTGRTGGTVTLAGAISDGADAGGGIVVGSNTGGSTVFSGSSKVLNTGAGDAVLFTASDGHTLSFQGGGLDIDTTSGRGIEALTAGTIDVRGTGNSISTTTGRALNVTNTDIGSSDLTFQSISANGAPNGIVLSNTGSAGNLAVTGAGGTCTAASTAGCSGGVIRNSTGGDDGGAVPAGTGIVLNNTRDVSLTRMHIHNHTNYGIRGTSVVGFTMADSVINALSNGRNGTSALTAHKDGSVRFEELTGTVSMTNVEISHGYFTNLMVDNTAGTLNATLDNVDSGLIDATGGDDAVQFEGIGTSDMNVAYMNSQVTTATGDLFQYIGDGTGGGDLDLTGNTFSNNEPSIATGGGGIALVAGAKGPATMDVLNNTMRDSKTNALTIIKSRDNAAGTNNLVANITGNTIGAAPANSGSAEGDGMEITTFGDGNATFNVTNNTIRQYNSSGIQFVAGSGVVDSGQFNLNVSGNVIGSPGNNPSITLLQGIRVDSGVTAGDTFASCVDFGTNSITGSSDAADKDFRLVASQSTTLRQPGYGGGATDGAAFAAFAAAQIGGGAQGTAVANPPATFSGTGTACP